MIYSNNFSSSIQEKYSSPKCKIVGLKVKNLLCMSDPVKTTNIQSWSYDSEELDF